MFSKTPQKKKIGAEFSRDGNYTLKLSLECFIEKFLRFLVQQIKHHYKKYFKASSSTKFRKVSFESKRS